MNLSNPVTAIDIILVPDATMMSRAEAANSRLRKVFPQGFALDAAHHPHVSMLMRYVPTADLDKVFAATGDVFAQNRAAMEWRLKALKYVFMPADKIGLASIVVEPTADMLGLQQELIDAIAPLEASIGTAAAFITSPEEPVNQATIDYVAEFVPKHSGANFVPHVTVGIALQDDLKKMLAEPFSVFTFSPTGAAVYQLGNYGAARVKLKAF